MNLRIDIHGSNGVGRFTSKLSAFLSRCGFRIDDVSHDALSLSTPGMAEAEAVRRLDVALSSHDERYPFGFESYDVEGVARWVVNNPGEIAPDSLKDRCRMLMQRCAVREDEEARSLLDRVCATAYTKAGVGVMVALASQILGRVDATSCAGPETVRDACISGYHDQFCESMQRASPRASLIMPLPAKVENFHSPEAIALAGIITQHARSTGDTQSRAYKLASKIIKEATGVERG